MTKKTLVAAVLGALIAGGIVGGATIAMAQADVIKQRQDNRKQAAAAMRAIKGIIDAKGDAKTAVPQAAKLKDPSAGYDPLPYIEQHHGRITNLHLKDRKKNNGMNLPWGEGETAIKPVLQLLKQKKYALPAMIEWEYQGSGKSVVEVAKCLAFVKAALA